MLIEIASPAVLPFGLVRFEGQGPARTCMLGLALQHPPIQLFAQAAERLAISGARANVAHRQAERFFAHRALPPSGDFEIELAIPRLIGLGSEPLLGLSMARAMAWLNDLPLDDTPALARSVGIGPGQALEVWAFDQGGLLLVDTPTAPGPMPPIVQRRPIAHPEREAWAFVLHFPRFAPDTPDSLESDRLTALLDAAVHLDPETGRLCRDLLWPALEQDDSAVFGQALMEIQRLNREALDRAGAPNEVDTDPRIFDVMRTNGAQAWGRPAAGEAYFGLVRGAAASQDLRKALGDHVGIYGGTVMAAITDNHGARHQVKREDLNDYKPPASGVAPRGAAE